MKIEEIRTYLENIATGTTIDDQGEDAVVFDYTGSNVDDAYSMGMGDGKIYLAREILTKINDEPV